VHSALLLGHPANSEVAKLSFSNSSSGRRFFPETFRKISFWKNLLPEEEFVISGSTQKLLPEERHPECFRKKVLPETSGRRFFRRLVFLKKIFYFVIIYF